VAEAHKRAVDEEPVLGSRFGVLGSWFSVHGSIH